MLNQTVSTLISENTAIQKEILKNENRIQQLESFIWFLASKIN